MAYNIMLDCFVKYRPIPYEDMDLKNEKVLELYNLITAYWFYSNWPEAKVIIPNNMQRSVYINTLLDKIYRFSYN